MALFIGVRGADNHLENVIQVLEARLSDKFFYDEDLQTNLPTTYIS